jgi:RimJ/RimL family protein N-acetyltransferase
MPVADYSAPELLRDGRRIEIRALKPDDRDDLLAAVARTSAESLYRRFFGPKRSFSAKEVDFFTNVDFSSHVALVAVTTEDDHPAIVGGGRYVVIAPTQAEVAFIIIDQYQGLGIGTLLLRHLAMIARDAGLNEFVAEVLSDNGSMLDVFEHSGMRFQTRQEGGVVHVNLQLARCGFDG